MRCRWALICIGLTCSALAASNARAQQKEEEDKPPAGAIIQKTFITKCMGCHPIGSSEGRIPSRGS